MHKEILNEKQIKLLSLVKKFNGSFGLVGGTAIALQIGHRESIDFDLFSCSQFDNGKIRQVIKQHFDSGVDIKTIRDEVGEYSVFIDSVKFTFFYYPFPITFSVPFDDVIKIPNLQTLAAMKAYALGRRAKWKDYVDLYFIFQQYSLSDIVNQTKKIFTDEFNEKNFREQLNYFEDIDHTEKVIFCNNVNILDEEVRQYLSEMSIS